MENESRLTRSELFELVWSEPMSTLAHSPGRQGEELLVHVRDSGAGAKDATVIFEPFFTTKVSGMGMGMGLSISLDHRGAWRPHLRDGERGRRDDIQLYGSADYVTQAIIGIAK